MREEVCCFRTSRTVPHAAGMSKASLVITAVVVEGRTVSEAAAAYGVSRSWAYELVARYRVEGDRALEPSLSILLCR